MSKFTSTHHATLTVGILAALGLGFYILWKQQPYKHEHARAPKPKTQGSQSPVNTKETDSRPVAVEQQDMSHEQHILETEPEHKLQEPKDQITATDHSVEDKDLSNDAPVVQEKFADGSNETITKKEESQPNQSPEMVADKNTEIDTSSSIPKKESSIPEQVQEEELESSVDSVKPDIKAEEDKQPDYDEVDSFLANSTSSTDYQVVDKHELDRSMEMSAFEEVNVDGK